MFTLDKVFIKALSDHVAPFSYGAEWVLTSEFPNRMQAVAPVAWAATGATKSILQLSPEWYDTSLAEVGIVPGSRWEVDHIHGGGGQYYDVATNSKDLFDALRLGPKEIARVGKYLTKIPLDGFDDSKYKFKLVLRDWLSRGIADLILTEKDPETIDAELEKISRLTR
jgi:hypothetical protein